MRVVAGWFVKAGNFAGKPAVLKNLQCCLYQKWSLQTLKVTRGVTKQKKTILGYCNKKSVAEQGSW